MSFFNKLKKLFNDGDTVKEPPVSPEPQKAEPKVEEPAPEPTPEPAPVKETAPTPPPRTRWQTNIVYPHIITLDGKDLCSADTYSVSFREPENLDKVSLYNDVELREENGKIYAYKGDARLGYLDEDSSYPEAVREYAHTMAQVDLIDTAKNELGIAMAFFNTADGCPKLEFTLEGLDQIDEQTGYHRYELMEDVSESEAVEFVYNANKDKLFVFGNASVIGEAGYSDARKLIDMVPMPEWVCGIYGVVESIERNDERITSVKIKAYRYLSDM